MVDSREVMNIRQASQYLGVSPDTLYKYVYEERIPAFKLGNRWKFKKTILTPGWSARAAWEKDEARRSRRPHAARLPAINEATVCLEWAEQKRLWAWISAPAASRQWS